MDEPFSSLDCALKNRLIDDFSKIWAQDKRTVIFVSHNEDEISRLAQEVLTFSDKRFSCSARNPGLIVIKIFKLNGVTW